MPDANQVPRLIRLRPAQGGESGPGAATPEGLAQRLRESEERLRLALAAARMVTWEWDVPRNEVHVTGGLTAILGLGAGPTSLLYPSHLAPVHPSDCAHITAAEQQALAGGGEYTVEFRVLPPDGTVRWLAETGRVVARDAGGGPLRVLGVVQDVTERRELQERLIFQASHDPLTRLPNREVLIERLTQALTRCGEDGGVGVAVLFLDLDGFKAVNDRFGHAAGDRLLVAVAERVRGCIRTGGERPADTLARLGGDEFVLLLENVTGGIAERVAARILAALRLPFAIEGENVLVGASIGIALGASLWDRQETLLRAADAALYRAKAAPDSGYALAAPAPPLGDSPP